MVIPWKAVFESFTRNNLVTPHDYMSYYKNIIHRGIGVRKRFHLPDVCRLCGSRGESSSHLLECSRVHPIWVELFRLLSEMLGWRLRPSFAAVYFCISPRGRLLSKGVCTAIRLTWKFILMDFHMVDMVGSTFFAPSVLPRAMRRLYERILAWEQGWQRQAFLQSTNGIRPAISPTRVTKVMGPFASDATEEAEERALCLHPRFQAYLTTHGVYAPPTDPE